MSEKMIMRVLREIENAPSHSHDISDELGISVKEASSYLSELKAMGLIVVIGQVRLNRVGPISLIYNRCLVE